MSDIILFSICLLFALFMCFFSFNYIEKSNEEILAAKQIINCKLLSKNYKGSTLATNAVPMVGMSFNGSLNTGVGFATTGSGKEFITIFDCGDRGTIVSNNENIFRLASDGENSLEISFYDNKYKIFSVRKMR